MDTYAQIITMLAGSNIVHEEISVGKLLLTLFLVFLNGFFVAAEFAIVKVRTSQIEVHQELNSKVAVIAKGIVGNLDAYLAATQLGITLASLGLGWVGESSLTPVIMYLFEFFGFTGPEWYSVAKNISFPLAFAIITILHIVFGELAPKSLAIHFPTKTTFTVAWPLRIFYFVFRPIIWLMNGLANGILRLMGISPIHGADIHTEEELKMIITESQEGGAIEETERVLIQNVFDFDDRRVNNIQSLRKNVSAIEINTSVLEAIDYAINEGYSRFPVYEDNLDNIKGVIYTKDLMKAMIQDKTNASLASLLREPIYISENTLIKNVLKQFQAKHLQMAIATNEVGEFTGIVTMEDILEELVGEIQDEYDNEEPVVVNIGEGRYVVSAHYNLSDINRLLPIKFEESEHYDTLAGLISEECANDEFNVGDVIRLDDYEGKILKMYRNSVEQVELSLLTKDQKENQSEDK
ncbi:hemolysin family protein [Myroides sp. M-43]|uniref:hemolysin family protein n=1 Tax=Myroides oncorhynchi TaxID=2893756 RepID=UPI001E4BCD02|nr:hemolysin family protein [Myroides oncorhynchi]MCC9041485.1 hemolysin family protein [Myroides oncorhynchi]